MDDGPAKRKYPSGASKRKAKKERDAQAGARSAIDSYANANNWGALNYAKADAQFDPNKPPFELPLYGQPPVVLVSAVAAVIAQLEQGSFYSAGYLWDGMLRDDRIASTLGVRLDRLLGSPMDIEPAISEDDEDDQEDSEEDEAVEDDEEDGEDDAEELDLKIALKAAKDCERVITQIMPLHQVYELMRTALGLSVGIAQKLTTRTIKSTTPTFSVWNNRHLRYDWLLRQYRMQTQNQGEITIERGDPEWMIYEPFGPMGWLHGAMLRPLVHPWLMRYWTRVWWSRYQEVHGQPIRLGIIPATRTPQDESIFLSQLSNIGHEAVIRLPQGSEDNRFDVKLLEAQSNNWEGFKELLQHCDDCISIVFLGQKMSTDGQGGLGSTENAGESTMMRITRKDSLVCNELRDQLLKPWAKDNYGNEEYAPKICFQTDPPEDESKTAAVDFSIAQALVAFKTASAPISMRRYLTERGYQGSLMTEDEEKAQKDAAMKEQQDMMKAQGDNEKDNPGANPKQPGKVGVQPNDGGK